jgi:hypothetical protein
VHAGEPGADDLRRFRLTSADRGRRAARDRGRLRIATGDDAQQVAGGVVDVLGDAPLLVDDPDEATEAVIVVALLARERRRRRQRDKRAEKPGRKAFQRLPLRVTLIDRSLVVRAC